MNRTSRVLIAMGAVTLMAYGSALAQAPGDKPPQAPPGAASPASPASPAQAGGRDETATGELLSVNAASMELTVKGATGEMTIKYDDKTKVSGASKTTAGLATQKGSQVTVRYRKEGASNIATSIDVKEGAGAAPLGGAPKPGGGDRPSPPGGGDPSKPPTPRP